MGIWLMASILAAAAVMVVRYNDGLSELDDWARQTDVLLSEKLAQHDAHMTALSAIIRMSPNEPAESVQGLAQSVTAFYPRITDVATIRIEKPDAPVIAYGAQNGPFEAQPEPAAELPVLNKPGDTAVRPAANEHTYSIYKLVDAGRLLRLKINAAGLLGIDRIPPEYSVSLFLGEALLFERAANAQSLFVATTQVSANNVGQPLKLSIGRSFSLRELLPPFAIAPLLAIVAAAIWMVDRYRHASRERRRQEQRAALLEQETRLAHAGRVNALGEMASGIAHELAQPVAALLAQSQAARRAVVINRPDILEQTLDANVREAKRAGDILGRMRAYISGADARIETVTLEDALAGSIRLIETDLAQRGVILETSLPGSQHEVAIDVISFQQVIHNLIRNAAEAMVGQPEPRIWLTAAFQAGDAIITIRDNGPGMDTTLLDRIFDPFFTTKPDGMGLGLPLCARLVEKMDGTIEARNEAGACFMIRLPVREPA